MCNDLGSVINMPAIAAAGLKIGVDPMGGAGIAYWEPIAESYGLNLEVVNPAIDPTFGFMTVDKDGKIRMDCSSPYAMASLIGLKDQFDIAFGNDPDYDRHGIVTQSVGLLNPNHYLAVAIWYLFQNRPGWRPDAAVGKTLVSSSMIDGWRPTLGRRLAEVPVGFKYFVDGLVDGSYGFGGEESAGASFLRQDGTVWTTDKDGFYGFVGGGDHGRDRARPRPTLPDTRTALRQSRLRTNGRPGQRGAKSGPGQPLPRHGRGGQPGRRNNHRQAHPRPRQQRTDRRPQSRHRKWLVCRPAVRHRGNLQNLRRKLQG
jgi:hypothetical protein